MNELTNRHCFGCNVTKPIIEFGKDKYRKAGYTFRCKKCRAVQSKKWADANPEKVKETNLKSVGKRKEYYNTPERKMKYRARFIERTFGIRYSEYEQMQINQNNLCAICEKPEISTRVSYLSVDHCHSTGRIRGLLCTRCNQGIGYFNDDSELLNKAINYILTKK